MNKRRNIEEIATRLVNLKNEVAAQNFLKDYGKWFGISEVPREPNASSGYRILGSDRPLKTWKQQPSKEEVVRASPTLRAHLRDWQAQSARLTGERSAGSRRKLLRQIMQWSQQLRGAWGQDRDSAEDALAQMLAPSRVQTPRQVKLGSAQIEPRDLPDMIAIAILKASERGLLRTCEGHKQGWQCPTPYLVADEKRRVYCYMSCGDEAKSRAKHAWWKRNLSAGALKHKAVRKKSP